MRKNVASQVIGAQMVSATDGSAITSGTVTVYVTGNGGTQAAGSVGSGACTHEGNGFYTYAPAQAETNYDHIAFTFTHASAVPATVQVYPTFPQTGDSFALIGTTGSGLTSLASQASVNTIDDFLDTEVAAILAAVDTEVGAIKTKTDFLPSATAGSAGGVFIAGSNAATSITTALTANITGNLSGSVGSVTGAVGSVTGAVGSVTGAVGSVTGNVGGNVAGSVGSVTGLTASDVGAIKTKTDYLPSATAGAAGGVFIAGANAATSVNITGNVTGNLSGSVGSVTGAVGSVTGAVGSVTGNVGGSVGSVTGAVGSVTGAVGSVTGAVGSVTAGVTVTTNNDKTGYTLSNAGVDALYTRQLTESYAADGAAPTVAQALMLIQQMLGDFAITGTTLTVKKVDGSTTAGTFTLNDGTSPTSVTRAT